MDLVVPCLEQEPEEDQIGIDQPEEEYFEEYNVGKDVASTQDIEEVSGARLIPTVFVECLEEDIKVFDSSWVDIDEKEKEEEEEKEIVLERALSVSKPKKMKKEVTKFAMKTKDFHLSKTIVKKKDIE